MNELVMLVQVPLDWGKPVLKQKRAVVISLSLSSLAHYLKKKGIKSSIIDCDSMDIAPDKFEKILVESRPDIVGFTSTTFGRFSTIDAIKKTKLLLPDAMTIVGGWHFPNIAEETLREVPEIDVVVRGEGEISLYELVLAKRSGGDLRDVLGITYRQGDSIVSNPDRPLHDNLDDFAILERIEPEGVNFIEKTKWGTHAFPIMTGRRCPNRCTFCSLTTGKHRSKSIETVMKEIMIKHEMLGIKSISFHDPALTIKKDFVKELCTALKKTGIGFKWHCMARVTTDFELLKEMKSAGCESVEFGLESGSPKVLKAIRKGIALPRVEAFAKVCYELGLKTQVFNMISLPEELPEDAQMTLDVLARIEKYVSTFTFATTMVFPGTQLEIEARQKKILPEGFTWFDRAFNNGHPDLALSHMPLYFECLTPEYVRTVWIPEFKRLLVKSKISIPKLIVQRLRPTLFDWESEGVINKLKRIKTALQYIKYKLS